MESIVQRVLDQHQGLAQDRVKHMLDRGFTDLVLYIDEEAGEEGIIAMPRDHFIQSTEIMSHLDDKVRDPLQQSAEASCGLSLSNDHNMVIVWVLVVTKDGLVGLSTASPYAGTA